MLCEIHQHMKIENGIDPTFVQEAIHSDNEWALYWKYSGSVLKEKGQTPAVVDRVQDILEMWEAIEVSYENLSDEDKKRIDADENPFVSIHKFSGFDGNSEAQYIGIARFLIDRLESWSYLKGRKLNSHFPSLEAYERMLSLFQQHPVSQKRFELTATEIREILKMQHPESGVARGAFS